jgi:hypothetical protein
MNRSNRLSAKLAAVMTGVGVAFLLASAGNLSARNLSPAANVSVAQSGIQSAANPNLAGQWKLNKDQSDDPRQKMQQAMGNSGEGAGQGGGGGHRGGGNGGAGGGRGPGGMMNDMSQLTIEETATSVKVTGASGRVLAANPAEQPAAKPATNGNGEGETREYTPPVAKWQGAQLVTSMEGHRGGSTTRTYELSPDGKQLIVTTKMQNPRLTQPVSIRFVYDPAKAGSTE